MAKVGAIAIWLFALGAFSVVVSGIPALWTHPEVFWMNLAMMLVVLGLGVGLAGIGWSVWED